MEKGGCIYYIYKVGWGWYEVTNKTQNQTFFQLPKVSAQYNTQYPGHKLLKKYLKMRMFLRKCIFLRQGILMLAVISQLWMVQKSHLVFSKPIVNIKKIKKGGSKHFFKNN